MAFEGLTEKISATFKKLRGKGRLKEADVKEAMREIRMALLEADVSYKVVKDFTKSVTERCIGADVLESLTPAQMIVKIVNEELCKLIHKCVDIFELSVDRSKANICDFVGVLKLIHCKLTDMDRSYLTVERVLKRGFNLVNNSFDCLN